MRFVIAILCCMMIVPAVAYAQNDAEQLQIEYEQYTLKRTGEVLVKVFGEIEMRDPVILEKADNRVD